MAARLFGAFYTTMMIAGYVVGILFGPAGLVLGQRNAQVLDAAVTWNYTTVPNGGADLAFFAHRRPDHAAHDSKPAVPGPSATPPWGVMAG